MERGQAEQFNWIFVIISGAIILGFFVMFAFKYIDLQEKRQDVRSIVNLGSALNVLEKLQVGDEGFSVDSNNPDEGLRFGYELNLNFECLDDKARLYINYGEIANYDLDEEIVFINNANKLEALDMWVVPWRYPFHITNFIFLSNPKIKYYFIYDESSRDFVNELDIGKAINVERVNKNNLEIKDNSKYIFFTGNIPNINQKGIVYVDLRNSEVKFFDEEWSESVKYYGDKMLLGAVFIDTKESYECNINNALNKLKESSLIYLEKAKVLNQLSKDCNYGKIISELSKFAEGNFNNFENLNELNKGKEGCLWVF